MTAYRVKAQLAADGCLALQGLPFNAGDTVDILLTEDVAQTPEANPDPDEIGHSADEIAAYMERQAERFRATKSDLLDQYHGLYVWIEDGIVIDVDASEEKLVLRALEQNGPRPLFVKQVLDQEPVLSIHGFAASKAYPIADLSEDQRRLSQ